MTKSVGPALAADLAALGREHDHLDRVEEQERDLCYSVETVRVLSIPSHRVLDPEGRLLEDGFATREIAERRAAELNGEQE